MEDAELVARMIQELEKTEKRTTKAAEETDTLLKTISESRIGSLREAIEEITLQIRLREGLHAEMLQDIESLKSGISNMMSASSGSAEFQKAEVEFRKKIIEADEMKVQEKLNCFRDVALLKKELRELIQEFREKESRASVLGSLLE
ncbi:MAG TPA: hypothetical protein VJC03_04420 [bacterium]|nr:hypothetical protein [bacterium]